MNVNVPSRTNPNHSRYKAWKEDDERDNLLKGTRTAQFTTIQAAGHKVITTRKYVRLVSIKNVFSKLRAADISFAYEEKKPTAIDWKWPVTHNITHVCAFVLR